MTRLSRMVRHLDSISGDTKGGRFAAALACRIRELRTELKIAKERALELEIQVYALRDELSRARSEADRRKKEIHRLASALRALKEKRAHQ